MKVLIAEEEDLTSLFIKKKLTELGINCFIVKNKTQLFSTIRQKKPHLVLMGVSQKDLSYLERTMKEEAIPVIVIFNSNQPSLISRVESLGFKHWITKTDFDIIELINKIKKVCQQYSLSKTTNS